MNILITTEHNIDFWEISSITLPIIQQYSTSHGYSFMSRFTDLKSPDIVWMRMDTILDNIRKYDVVVHIDADCMITNPRISIEQILPDGFDSCMSQDWNGINDGFSAWMNTWNSVCAIRSIIEDRIHYTSPQDAISRFHRKSLKMHVFNQRETNSYMTNEYGPIREESEWSREDFILHLPGIGNNRRVEILKSLQ